VYSILLGSPRGLGVNLLTKFLDVLKSVEEFYSIIQKRVNFNTFENIGKRV